MDKLLLFSSIRDVMKADRLCRNSGLKVKVMPIPHTYTTECGMCLIIHINELDSAIETLNSNQISYTVESYSTD